MTYYNDLTNKMRKIADSSDPDRMAVYSTLHEAADCIGYLVASLRYLKNDIELTIQSLEEKFGQF